MLAPLVPSHYVVRGATLLTCQVKDLDVGAAVVVRVCFPCVLLLVPCFCYGLHFCVAGYILGYMVQEERSGLHNLYPATYRATYACISGYTMCIRLRLDTTLRWPGECETRSLLHGGLVAAGADQSQGLVVVVESNFLYTFRVCLLVQNPLHPILFIHMLRFHHRLGPTKLRSCGLFPGSLGFLQGLLPFGLLLCLLPLTRLCCHLVLGLLGLGKGLHL